MVTRKNYHSKRYAFTMIELIFAIVVIAIAVLSLPTMTGATQKAIDESIAQEAVFATSASLMGAGAGYWDEYSMQDVAVSKFSRVLNVSGDCNTSTKLRPGHINQVYHRRCLDDTTVLPFDMAYDINGIYDLDDVSGSSNLFTFTTTSSSGYKKTYTNNISVSRNGNVKTIVSTISDSDGVVVKLKMQSANVGEVDFYKRTL